MCKSFQLSKPWADKKKGLRKSPKKKNKKFRLQRGELHELLGYNVLTYFLSPSLKLP